MPTKLAEMAVEGGRLISIPVVKPEAGHLVGLVTARRDPQTPVIQALIEDAERLAK